MRLYTVDGEGKMIPFKEKKFEEDSLENDLEVLLEKNPEYFFEDSKILITGRQVTTNLNSFIDLVGIDKYGNVIVIELKRNKTPRETIAQILEYASFVEKLDYEQLNDIFKDYSGGEVSLDDYHQDYFQSDEKVSFNKNTKLIIVAQVITKEIKQTAMYLRSNGIDLSCMEFRYFTSKTSEKILTSDFVVGDEEFIRQKIKSESLPIINKEIFVKSLDQNGTYFFDTLFKFAEENKLFFIWGSKGFSMNIKLRERHVALLFGYPPHCVYKQSIVTAFAELGRNLSNSEDVVELYKSRVKSLGIFTPTGKNLRWLIDRETEKNILVSFLKILREVIDLILSGDKE